MRDGELVAARCGRSAGPDKDDVVDKVAGNGDLGADVAELGNYAPKEGVLAAQGLVHVAGALVDGLFGLIRHIGIGDFGDGREKEDDSQQEHKRCDPEIHPLHTRQALPTRAAHILENHVRRQHGCNNGADSLKRLGQIETHFAIFGWSAGGDEGVGRRFKGGEAGADDEHGAAEAAKGAFNGRGPKHEGADAVNAEAGDECPSVAKAANYPAGVG